jgi:hypothetical protein
VLSPRRCATCSCAWRSRKLYRARWTERIHDEWTRNVLRQRPDLEAEDLQRTRSLMNQHVRDSLVTGYEHLEASIELPDPGDRHVVAAAIQGGAHPDRQVQPEGLSRPATPALRASNLSRTLRLPCLGLCTQRRRWRGAGYASCAARDGQGLPIHAEGRWPRQTSH